MPLPPIPADILAAEASLQSEFITSIEQIIDAAEPVTLPGGGNDLYLGTDTANVINGLAGNDALAGFGGNDTIDGGEGDDYALGGLGSDKMFGGAGNDFLFGEAGNETMDGGGGDDAMFGGANLDTMAGGDGNDWMYGNGGGDKLTGGFGDDLLDGGAANDVLTDDAGNDILIGGVGADQLSGGADNDETEGGVGADVLSGGVGSDVYIYAARNHGNDTIMDFESSNDSFQFAGLGFRVDPGTTLEDGVTFVANAAPVSVVQEATVLYNTSTGQLWFDVDGTGAAAAQLIATIEGAAPVTHQDFIFI